MKENKFQSDLIRRLKDMFPGCMIMKNIKTCGQLLNVKDLRMLAISQIRIIM